MQEFWASNIPNNPLMENIDAHTAFRYRIENSSKQFILRLFYRIFPPPELKTKSNKEM